MLTWLSDSRRRSQSLNTFVDYMEKIQYNWSPNNHLSCSATKSEQQAQATLSFKELGISSENMNRHVFEAIFYMNW